MSDGPSYTLTVDVDGQPRTLDSDARPLEIVPFFTPVPLAPEQLAGLAQLDGEVLPVVWAGALRTAVVAVVVASSHGRVLVLCGRVLPPGEESAPLDVNAIMDTLRHEVRG